MKQWALLVGKRTSGKTLLAGETARALSERGIRVGGFLQEPCEEEGVRVGYVLRRIAGGEAVPLARRSSTPRGPEEESFCSFVFDRRAFAVARAWVEEDLGRCDAVILDEVSKLETAGGGHHDAIARCLETDAVAVLAVRAEELFAVMERFGLDEPVAVLETDRRDRLPEFVEAVAAAAARRRFQR